MAHTIAWHQLRIWNGSQQDAFEELVCQLARQEDLKGTFVRKGRPDGGVECFWQLTSGQEVGYQAKFLTEALGTTQWAQIDKSVRTALRTHPGLGRYIVAIPVDRSDARLAGQRSMLEKWNAHVAKWRQTDAGKGVKFEFWGSFELVRLLQHERNRGLTYYWFQKDYLSTDWFARHTVTATARAGPRYSPELNIKLPIAEVLDGLARNSPFRKAVRTQARDLRRAASGPIPALRASWSKAASLATGVADLIADQMETLAESPTQRIDTVDLAERALQAVEVIREIADVVDYRNTAFNAHGKEDQNSIRNFVLELRTKLYDARAFLTSERTQAANGNRLLLRGDAGTGKTHLLVDFLRERTHRQEPMAIAFGDDFGQANPVAALGKAWNLETPPSELLASLDALGQAFGRRFVIAIDALNETPQRSYWEAQLPALLAEIDQHPHLTLVASVRTHFEKETIREGLFTPDQTINHQGLADVEFDALASFFSFFGIEYPSAPPTAEEFQNPLFLKLLCKSLQSRGETALPRGNSGILRIFEAFVDTSNERLSRKLDLLPSHRLLQTTIDAMATKMGAKGQRWLAPNEAAACLATPLAPSFLTRMVEDGILRESVRYERAKDSEDFVRNTGIEFGYERLGDNAIARSILTRIPEPVDSSNIAKGGSWSLLLELSHEPGLAEQLLIQLAARQEVEIPTLTPDAHRLLAEPFLAGMLWRQPAHIRPQTIKLAQSYWNSRPGTSHPLGQTSALISLATIPDHPLNAQALHAKLKPQGMSERDVAWSIPLQEANRRNRCADRLLAWIERLPRDTAVDPEVGHLAAIAFAWMCTSSDRSIRDRATKGIVRLLDTLEGLAKPLWSQFRDVSDPYVLERVTAALYGHFLRRERATSLKELGRKIALDTAKVRHLLVRDYAERIADLAYTRYGTSRLNRRPPKWIEPVLSPETLKRRTFAGSKPDTPAHSGAWRLWDSVMEHGDFARYIIGTNSGTFAWTGRPLRGRRPLTHQERVEQLNSALSAAQLKAWKDVEKALHELRTKTTEVLRTVFANRDKKGALDVDYSSRTKDEQSVVEYAQKRLSSLLSKGQRKEFDELKPFDGGNQPDFPFDLRKIQRRVMESVLRNGWNAKQFGAYDAQVARDDYGRTTRKPERIGKKYQWIGLHEVLAEVADHFEFAPGWRSSHATYRGAWQVGARDIDPSSTLRATKRESFGRELNCDWKPAFTQWGNEPTANWLADKAGWPSLEQLLLPTVHVLLDGDFTWREPIPEDVPDDSVPHRQVTVHVSSALVAKRHLPAVRKWMMNEEADRELAGDVRSPSQVFLGEIPHSTPWELEKGSYGNPRGAPSSWRPTTMAFGWEGSYDQSTEQGLYLQIPSAQLMEAFDLRFTPPEGEYESGTKPLFFDPSVASAGPGALLALREDFLAHVAAKKLALVWHIYGQKDLLDHHREAGYAKLTGYCILSAGQLEAHVLHETVRPEARLRNKNRKQQARPARSRSTQRK